MAQLAVWLLICGVAALVLRNRLDLGVAAVIMVWTLVPAVGGQHLTGLFNSAIAFHPATWLVLALVAVQLVFWPHRLAATVARHYLIVLALGVFVVGALATSVLSASGGTRLLADQVLGPALLWWLIVAGGTGDRRFLLVVRNAVLAAMAVQSVLALVQLGAGEILFYAGDYERLPWFKPETFERWMGTADSPLVLSLGACIAAALAVGLRSSVLRFGLLGLFAVATVITQSRTGTAVLALIIVYAIVRSRMALWARAAASVVVLLAGAYLTASTLFEGLAARFADDTGSTNARVLASRFVFDNIADYFFTGRGLISSYAIARDAGLETSLENSYLMYVIDTGLLLATLYFGCQLAVVARYGWQRAMSGLTVAALLATLLQHTFSAVAFANFSGTLIWTTLGLLVVAASLPASAELDVAPSSPAGAAAPQSWSRTAAPPSWSRTAAPQSRSRTGAPAAARARTSSSW